MFDAIDFTDDDSLNDYASFAQCNRLWDGRHVEWQEASSFCDDVEARVFELFNSLSGNDFDRMAANLASLGYNSNSCHLLEREVNQLGIFNDRVVVLAGFGKSCKDFWKKHKTAILIGIAVLVVITAVVVISVCSGGAAAGAAITAGAGGLALESKPNEEDTDTHLSRYETMLDVLQADLLAYGPEISAADFETKIPYENYATTFAKGNFTADYEFPPPYEEMALIGSSKNPTIHYHCGIRNSSEDVYKTGLIIHENLGSEFTIHPHRIHSEGFWEGYRKVKLGVMKEISETVPTDNPIEKMARELYLGKYEKTDIHLAINYEAENLSNIANQIIKQNDPELKQFHITFSNGGRIFYEALKQLTHEQQQTIKVRTYGSTKIIPENMAFEAVNVIGSEDWPSINIHKNIETLKSIKGAKIIILPQQKEFNLTGGGHYILQKDYQDDIRTATQEAKRDYEIY